MIFPHNLLALLFVIPLLGSVVSYWYAGRKVRFGLLFAHLILSAWIAVEVFGSGTFGSAIGSWKAPFGIVLIVDPFAALMVLVSSFLFLCCLAGEKTGSPLYFLLQAGVSLSFISGDFFNLFVAFELMLTSSYAIMGEFGRRNFNAIYSYLSMNIAASLCYLIAIAVCYGTFGSLNFAALADVMREQTSWYTTIPVVAAIFALLIKSGIFPLYFWLPSSYPQLPYALAALFSGILSKVGIYALFRLLLTVFPSQLPHLSTPLLVLSCLTMLLGVMGAVSRGTVKGILSYHVLSQIGYMLFALSLSTPLAIAGGIFFLVHNMVVKSSLFMICGIGSDKCGSGSLSKMGGLWVTAPFLGLLFLLQAFSLAGLPPLSGFWGKYILFFEGFSAGFYFAVAIAAITSIFTLFSMLKIWNSAFIGESDREHSEKQDSSYLAAGLLTALALVMGIWAGKALEISSIAGDQLLDPAVYIQVSLASGGKG